MCTYAFITPSPVVPGYIYYFLNKIWHLFCKLPSIKEPQITLQNKETTVQNYQKISNQNAKKNPAIEFVFFNCTMEIRVNNFGYLNSALSLFDFYFLMNLRKKIYGACILTAEPSHSPYTSKYAFS